MTNLTMEQPTEEQWQEESGSGSGNIQLLNIWHLIKVGWFNILIFVVLGWILASAYFVTADSQFESKAQLYVMRKDSSLATQGVTGTSNEASVSEDLLATQMQIIQSRRILKEVLERGKPPIKDLPHIKAIIDEERNPVDYLIENLRVSRGGGGQARDAHVLNISFKHSSAQEAKTILEALLAEYEVYLKSKFQDVNKDAAVLIAQAKDELEDELETAEIAYRQFRENAPILWKEEGSTNIPLLRFEGIQDEISRLNLEISDAETRLSVVEEALSKFDDKTSFDQLALIDEKNAQRIAMILTVQQGKAETADFQAKQPERMENARTEYQSIMALRLKEQTLSEQFGLGPNHPEIASLRNQIELAKNFVEDRALDLNTALEESQLGPEQVMDSYLALLNNDLMALKARRSQLTKEAEKEESAARTMVKYEMEGESLQQKIARQQELYDTVVDRLRNINIAGDYGGVINDTITPPELGKVVWPKLPLCLALGTLFGLFMGGSMSLVSELRNRLFRSADEVKVALESPLLSHLPTMKPSSDRQLVRHIKRSQSKIAPLNYVHHLPQSVNAEVFRALRTSLFFKRKQGERVFSISSPNQADGKSTLTSCLATSIAQSGKSILLIDCDMRAPTIHNQFGVKNNIGLREVLESDQEPWEIIQSTEVELLSVLTAGGKPDNPAELLSSERFKNLLEVLRERFDFVLLDCPPLLPVSDPAIVAPIADGTLLLINVAKNSRPEAIQAKEILDSVGAKTTGVVVMGGESASNYVDGGFGIRYNGYYAQYGQENNHRPRSKRIRETIGT